MGNGIVLSSQPRADTRGAGTLLLSRSDVERLLTSDECIAAVEDAFRQHALGKAPPPGILGFHAQHGGFHIKAALLDRTAGGRLRREVHEGRSLGLEGDWRRDQTDRGGIARDRSVGTPPHPPLKGTST